MRPLHYVFLAAVLMAGIAGSLLLVPRESDLSLMAFRGHHFEDAMRLYENRLANGDRSADVVMPLAEVYVQSGEVGRAVSLLQRFSGPSSDHLELLRKVATFQKYGQEMREYRSTLEEIDRIQSSEDGLRELANQYRYANRTDQLIPALRTLLSRYRGEPFEFLELANLLAVGGRPAEAATVLERMEAQHPHDITQNTVEFLISVLLDSGDSERALDRAARWLEGHRNSGGVARFAMLLRSKGQPALAARLLAPFEPAIDGDPVLLAEWMQQQMGGKRDTEAFARLDRLRRRNQLPGDFVEPFIDLALARDEVSLAIDVAEEYGIQRLNGALLGMLAERALGAGREAFAYRAEAAMGDGFLANRPLLGARLAYARGDRAETARRLRSAEADANLPDADRLAAAGLDVKLGRQSEAVAQLERIRIEAASGDLLLETARLYVTVGKAADGARRFDGLRAGGSTAAIDRAWALVSAGAGRGPEVAGWLQAAPAQSIAVPLLRDLYFLAQDCKQPSLALAAAERLFGEHPGDANRLALANALTAAGRPAEALPHARMLLASTQEPGREEAYTAALLGAIRNAPHGADMLRRELSGFWTAKLGRGGQDEKQQLDLVYGLLELDAWDAALPRLQSLARRRGELVPLYLETSAKSSHPTDAVAFLKSELERKDLSKETREARVYALLERGGPAEALPYIRQLAAASPNWAAVYEDTLGKLGRSGELADFWRARLAGGALRAEEKRGIGFKLIDAGRPEWARAVFADLARNARPDSADVSELLFLWGPKPGTEALDWLDGRARGASGTERAAWLGLLLDAGAAERVAAIAAAGLPVAGQGGALLEVYLRALAALHRVDALAGVVARECGATVDRERVRKLARLARDAAGIAAEPAYARLLVLDPQDPEAVHWLGVFAYTQARYSVAQGHLSALLGSNAGAYDDNYYYAEMLWRAGSRSQARAYYGRALRLIEGLASPPAEARAAHAQALFRCGYLECALREYRTLIAADPRNGDRRADFAAMLLEAKLCDEAEDVLSAGVDSGRTRMALLRVQLLSATARRTGALAEIRGVAQANPDSANVIASLGLAEQNVGRGRRAQDLLDRAAGMDPGNEDLRESRDALLREREGPLQAGGEIRRIQGAEDDDLVRFAGERLLSRSLRLEFAAEQDQASVRSLRYGDGHVASFDGLLRRGEAALEWESDGGTRLKASLFGGNATAGGGVTLSRPDASGISAIQVDFNRPYWEIAESLARDGVRDRVEVRRETTLGPRVTVRAGAAANRYSLPGTPGAAESVSASGEASLRLRREPLVSLEYDLDAEYRIAVKTLASAASGSFQPLPLVSREVHAVSVRGEKKIARGLRVEAAGGMAVDRLGGSAPFWTAAVNYQASRHFEGKLDYDRRLYTLNTTRVATTFRIELLWRF